MNMRNLTVDKFLEELSSKAPVPGGGGASAMVGAAGCSLGSMVGNLTLGKKKYADVEEDIKVLIDKSEKLKEELLVLINEDAKAFEPLSKAYGLPKETPEEIAYKEKIMEEALYAASIVPLDIMRKIYEMIVLHEEYKNKGSRLAISDVAVGVIFCKSALLGASMNVFINTKSMKNRETAEKLNSEADKLIADGSKLADEIFNEIAASFRINQ
ncbi:MAG: cyclodeaminase/cyclohydrolase family protein [Lachnospiraceae bacterium]|nr:cyclodeaminase/cyclohydrolase family protein [Lachnospiraceae bacterium]